MVLESGIRLMVLVILGCWISQSFYLTQLQIKREQNFLICLFVCECVYISTVAIVSECKNKIVLVLHEEKFFLLSLHNYYQNGKIRMMKHFTII